MELDVCGSIWEVRCDRVLTRELGVGDEELPAVDEVCSQTALRQLGLVCRAPALCFRGARERARRATHCLGSVRPPRWRWRWRGSGVWEGGAQRRQGRSRASESQTLCSFVRVHMDILTATSGSGWWRRWERIHTNRRDENRTRAAPTHVRIIRGRAQPNPATDVQSRLGAALALCTSSRLHHPNHRRRRMLHSNTSLPGRRHVRQQSRRRWRNDRECRGGFLKHPSIIAPSLRLTRSLMFRHLF